MIQRKDLLTLNFYKSTAFTGSDGPLRYRIEKHIQTDDSGTETTCLRAFAWCGPFAFAHTPDDEKTSFTTEFSEDGLNEIVAWLSRGGTA